MQRGSQQSRPAWGPWWYALALAASVGFFVWTNGEMEPPPNAYRALLPWPDAPQYVDAARSLAEGEGYAIHVAGEDLPPRFPFGYSALLAVAHWAGVDLLECPLWVNRTAAIALLLAVSLPFARKRMWTAAGLAAVLLATRTGFIILARSPMSDLPGALVLLAGGFALHRAARSGERRWWMSAGVLLGLALNLRWGFLLLYGIVPAAAWAGRRKLQAPRALLFATAGLLAGAAPLLVYQTLAFGAPWATGYGFWLAQGLSDVFHPRFFSMQAAALWAELTQTETGPSTAQIYGGGSYFSPWFVALAAWSLWTLRRRTELLAMAAACMAYVGLMLLYFSVDMRLYFPLIVWAVPAAALAAAEAWRRASHAGKAALALLVAATMLGFPASRGDTDLGDLTRTSSLHMPAPEWESVEAYNQRFGGARSLILTDMDPPYVHALSDGDRIVAPVQDDHDYSHNRAAFRFGAAEREALVHRAVEEGRAVILLLARRPLAGAEGFEGRVWQVEFTNSAGGGLAVLAELQP